MDDEVAAPGDEVGESGATTTSVDEAVASEVVLTEDEQPPPIEQPPSIENTAAEPVDLHQMNTDAGITEEYERMALKGNPSVEDRSLLPHLSTSLSSLNMRTVIGRLKRHWLTDPGKEVFVFYDDNDVRTSLTNEEVQELVEKGASLLRCNGVHKGDVVLNALDISLEKEILDYAIMFAGGIVMDGSSLIDDGNYFWAPLNKADVKHIIVDPNDDNSIALKMISYDIQNSYADFEKSTIKEVAGLKKIFKFRMAHLIPDDSTEKACLDVIRAHEGMFVEIVHSYTPAALFVKRTSAERIYKLVLRSHLSVIHLALRAQEMLKLDKDDIVYNDWPLTWVSGGVTLPYITTGITCVRSTLHNCPAARVVRETWNLLSDEECTMAALEPQMIVMLASHCEDLPQEHWILRAITTSGIVKPSVMDAIGVVAHSVVNCYSVVEAGLVSRLVVTQENRTRFTEGCVGELSDPTRTKLDILGEGAVEPTKIGEIVLRGKLVAKEYYNDSYLTSASFTSDGFLKTGDLGFYDNTGKKPFNDMLFVLGRKSQAIIRGETAIFPRDIEEKVNQCPGIWKVAIVSMRDEKGIAQMCACVIPRSQDSVTIERVKEFCRYMLGGTADEDDNPHMPTYVFFFTDFPMIGNQVDKHSLAHSTAAVVNGTDLV